MVLSAKLKRRLEVALANRADAQELIAAVEAASPDLSAIEDRLDALETQAADHEARIAALEP